MSRAPGSLKKGILQMAISCQILTARSALDIEIGLEMSSKRISHKQKLEFIRSALFKKEMMQLAQTHCPEMLDEVITCEADILPWVDRFLDKLPEDVRKGLVND